MVFRVPGWYIQEEVGEKGCMRMQLVWRSGEHVDLIWLNLRSVLPRIWKVLGECITKQVLWKDRKSSTGMDGLLHILQKVWFSGNMTGVGWWTVRWMTGRGGRRVMVRSMRPYIYLSIDQRTKWISFFPWTSLYFKWIQFSRVLRNNIYKLHLYIIYMTHSL